MYIRRCVGVKSIVLNNLEKHVEHILRRDDSEVVRIVMKNNVKCKRDWGKEESYIE